MVQAALMYEPTIIRVSGQKVDDCYRKYSSMEARGLAESLSRSLLAMRFNRAFSFLSSLFQSLGCGFVEQMRCSNLPPSPSLAMFTHRPGSHLPAPAFFCQVFVRPLESTLPADPASRSTGGLTASRSIPMPNSLARHQVGYGSPGSPCPPGRSSSSAHSGNQPDNTTLPPVFPSLSPFPMPLPVIPRVTAQINGLPSNPCHGDLLLGSQHVVGASASFFHRLIQGTPTFAPPKQNSFNK